MPTSTRKGPASVPDPIATAMLARSPVRQSKPLRQEAGWEVSSADTGAALELADLTPITKVLVRASSSAVGSSFSDFGRARRDEAGHLVVGARPDEWIVFGKAGSAAATISQIEERLAGAEGLVTLVDVTHRDVVFLLSGTDARGVLEKICAIDLSDRTSPDGTAFRSRVAGVSCLVVREDRDGRPAYLIDADRSYGQYLFDVLVDAGAEFSVEVAGYTEVF